jgi:putative tryptophan/tyrosine transport system substrate-binding protein
MQFKSSCLRRREFITLLCGAAAGWPLALRAQESPRVVRIGFLGSGFPSAWASRLEALRAGLNDFGYLEGKNLLFEFRWAEGGKYEQLRELAAELVSLKVDILVTYGTPGTLAAKHATTTIPVVMVHSGDAVATGIVTSLARPGGNITGSTLLNPELMAKRLDLLKETLPGITRAAVLLNPDNVLSRLVLHAMEIAAQSLNVTVDPFALRGPGEFEDAFSAMAQRRVDAVVIFEDAVFVANARAIGKLAERTKLLSAGFSDFAEAGGLIGYGANYLAMYRRAGFFVDKILKGARPAEIPIEQPTKFDLIINLKTAKALGLDVPWFLQQRADDVIE